MFIKRSINVHCVAFIECKTPTYLVFKRFISRTEQFLSMRQLKITKQVTNRETASLDKYLQEIGRVELITAQEEVELARKIRGGDKAALEKLTKANLRFVVSVAKQYANCVLLICCF